MPYTRHVTTEPRIFTYENKSLQIKYKCPQEPGYYQAKSPSAYIWPTNSPNQIKWWISKKSHIYHQTQWWPSLQEKYHKVDVHELTGQMESKKG